MHRYLRQLVELEYVVAERRSHQTGYQYRLVYEGQGSEGGRFLMGLPPLEKLLDHAGGRSPR